LVQALSLATRNNPEQLDGSDWIDPGDTETKPGESSSKQAHAERCRQLSLAHRQEQGCDIASAELFYAAQQEQHLLGGDLDLFVFFQNNSQFEHAKLLGRLPPDSRPAARLLLQIDVDPLLLVLDP